MTTGGDRRPRKVRALAPVLTNKKTFMEDLKMKKIIISLLITAEAAGSGAVDTYYTRPAYIEYIDGDAVTAVDNTGNAWTFYGDGYETGRRVRLVMDCQHTTTIYDDTVYTVLEA